MDLTRLVETLDYILSSTRKKHIVGGVLLSISALFSGLALTAMTLKKEEREEDE